MATKRILVSEKLGLNTSPMLQARVASGEAFERGAVLVSNQPGGFLAEAGANPTRVVGIAAAEIPTAGTGSTTDSGTYCPFWPALPHVGFEATVLGASAAQVALDNTMLFMDYGLTADASGNWYVDTSKRGSTSRVRIIELVDDTGTVDGRAVFIFMSTGNWLTEKTD